jgi:hypothetical protein
LLETSGVMSGSQIKQSRRREKHSAKVGRALAGTSKANTLEAGWVVWMPAKTKGTKLIVTSASRVSAGSAVRKQKRNTARRRVLLRRFTGWRDRGATDPRRCVERPETQPPRSQVKPPGRSACVIASRSVGAPSGSTEVPSCIG